MHYITLYIGKQLMHYNTLYIGKVCITLHCIHGMELRNELNVNSRKIQESRKLEKVR